MSGIEDDWRYQNAKDLRGQAFAFKAYRAYSPEWTHDHCAACMIELAEVETVPDALHEGWAISAAYEHGEAYEWVCAECFERLETTLTWTRVDPS
ncbi:MAG: hypothetical protein EON91_02065 [Brevundimonas sp.]|uniref:hypothetical protein n=1 Tax=Brevundimonas sp. TaxID=1871086 RepID=UPI00122720A1|nr:hypothetical protein [Brevundimonas sp.]RZJ19171.1 MAG: hypothetical protein EON91_02065 [Brevundimonas sp.]